MQARTPVHDDNERRKVLRFSNQEVIIALVTAGLVNMAMVMMASSAFHAGHTDVAEIETAYHTLTPLLGIAAAGVFLVSLIASGISSSVVGTMAGQMIMQGFVRFRIPILGSTAGNDDPSFHRRRSWCECDECARHQSSCAQYRPATSDDCAR